MMLKILNLKKRFFQGSQAVDVLDDISFEMNQGDSISIVGQSGSGKTTLLSLLGGLDRPNSGKIYFNEMDFGSLSDDQLGKLRSKKIGIIFQNYHLLSHLNAIENIMLPMEILRVENPRDKALKLLDDVGLSHRENHYPSELSGGEQQRVAVARAMSISPDLLLADEPSGSLDVKTGDALMELLFDLVKKNNMGLILVTHNMELAQKCKKVYILSNGQLELYGSL